MKGIYPAIVYVLLFSSGIFISLLIYNFIENYAYDKLYEIENITSKRLCYYLDNLKNKNTETEIDINKFSIISKNSKTEIRGKYFTYICNISSSGNCSGICHIISENKILKFYN